MSNQNTGDKPQIIEEENIKKHEKNILKFLKAKGYISLEESIELFVCVAHMEEFTQAVAKYGSLEAMEQQLIGLKEQHQNDILLAQAASEQITKLEKRVKELELSQSLYSRRKLEERVKELEGEVGMWEGKWDDLKYQYDLLTPKQ